MQDLGPTVFIVFILAAIGRRGVPMRLRLLWLVAGAVGGYYALRYPPNIVATRGLVPSLAHLAATAEGVLKLSARADAPRYAGPDSAGARIAPPGAA